MILSGCSLDSAFLRRNKPHNPSHKPGFSTQPIRLVLRHNNQRMGLVYAEIELINGDDLALERRRLIDRDAIKRITVPALVDTGAIMLCINENIQEQLQLPIVETRKAQMANGHIVSLMWWLMWSCGSKTGKPPAGPWCSREMQSLCWAAYPWRIWMC